MKICRRHRPGQRRAACALLLALLPLGGCAIVGEPVPGAPAHHREYGFANPSGATGTDPLEFLVDRLDLALGCGEDTPAVALAPADAAARWTATGDGDAVQWLGHASVRLRLDGTVLVVDPVLGPVTSPLPPFGPARSTPSPIELEALGDVDAILITHNHYDHLEPETINQIAELTRAPCLVPLRATDCTGITCLLVELDWGDSVALGSLTVMLLPAQHESGRGLFDRNRSLWGAWLIEGGGRRVYISGDTGYGSHFAAVGAATGGIDFVVLSVGGYLPHDYNHGIHMSPEEAVLAILDLRAERALVVHWGTYQLARESSEETTRRLLDAAAAAGLDPDALIIVPIGEAVPLEW